MNAKEYLTSLVGEELRTPAGRPNHVVAVADLDVIVGTKKAPDGRAVPIEWVQQAMDQLERDGEITIDVATVGYRSAFIGAVLSTLPGAVVVPTSPPRIRLR
jgi:hypothetical protein